MRARRRVGVVFVVLATVISSLATTQVSYHVDQRVLAQKVTEALRAASAQPLEARADRNHQ